jgi:hypothetical protein
MESSTGIMLVIIYLAANAMHGNTITYALQKKASSAATIAEETCNTVY